MVASTKRSLSLAIGLSLCASLVASRARAEESVAPAAQTPPAEGTHDEAHEHLRVGALASAGFPRPLSVEGMIRLERALGLGLEYGVLPRSSFGGVDVSAWSLAADARVFPFRGAFFLGLRAGAQHATASATVTVPSYGSLAESIAVDTWFVNPRVGFLWTFGLGISVGIDAGVQLPVSSSTSSTLPSQVLASSTVTGFTDVFSRSALPTFDLLQVGLLL